MAYRLIAFLALILCMDVRAAEPRGEIGHWKLAGGPSDSATPAHDGKPIGRVEFVDSPVATAAKALLCNGVDSALRVDGVPDAGAGDLSVSVWICPLGLRAAGIASRGDGGRGWAIDLANDHAVRFQVGGKTIKTPRDRIAFGQWYHVAATAHPGGHMLLYVNGQVAAEDELGTASAASDEPIIIGALSEKAGLFAGLISDVSVFNRLLTADSVATLTDAGLPWLRAKPRAKTPFAGKFSLDADDVVVMVGGEDACAAQSNGYLETLLAAGSAGKHVLFRNMAWEGDTVFEQWRILNFGPWSRQFERVGASVVFVQFGQMESLSGKMGLDEFAARYEKLLDEFQQRTQRIVLISPTPFQRTVPPFPDLTSHNADLKLYAEVVRKIAEKRGLLFVDLYKPLQEPKFSHPVARDGIHLTGYGQWLAARETARQLGVNATDPATDNAEPKFERKELESLRTTIREKNGQWLRYWRPTNWAFLNGDRVDQPSSHDHVDNRVRWLPAEVQAYSAIVASKEKQIAEQVKTLGQP